MRIVAKIKEVYRRPKQNKEIIRAFDEKLFDPVANVLRKRELNVTAETVRCRLCAAGVHSHPTTKKTRVQTT